MMPMRAERDKLNAKTHDPQRRFRAGKRPVLPSGPSVVSVVLIGLDG